MIERGREIMWTERQSDRGTGRRGDGAMGRKFLPVSRSHRLPVALYLCLSLSLSLAAFAQSGRNPASGKRVTVINVIAQRIEDPNKPRSLLSGDALQKEGNEK